MPIAAALPRKTRIVTYASAACFLALLVCGPLIEASLSERLFSSALLFTSVVLTAFATRRPAFALALPDMNQALKPAGGRLLPTGLIKILYYQRLIKNVRVLALGVVEEYRTSGLAAALYATLVRNARSLGYGDCEMSWILEDNVLMNRSLEVMGAKRYKTYRIYEWN